MVGTDKALEPKVQLIFKSGEKKGPLETVIIRTEEWENQQYIIHFEQKNRQTSVRKVISIGEYYPTDDPGWVPGCLFNPAIDQARAIFAKYGFPDRKRSPRRKKATALQGQARLFK